MKAEAYIVGPKSTPIGIHVYRKHKSTLTFTRPTASYPNPWIVWITIKAIKLFL